MPKKSIADPNSPFAVRLRLLMDDPATKITQTELAEMVGTTRQAIAQYRNGEVAPNTEKLCMIADHFNVSTDYLLGRSGERVLVADTQAMSGKIGLSDKAVNTLVQLQNDAQGRGATRRSWPPLGYKGFNEMLLFDETMLLQVISRLIEMEGESKSGLLNHICMYLTAELESAEHSKEIVLQDARTGGSYKFGADALGDVFLIWIQELLKDLRKNESAQLHKRAIAAMKRIPKPRQSAVVQQLLKTEEKNNGKRDKEDK